MALFRIFYLNQKTVKEGSGTADMWRRCQKTLPRSHPVYNLYEYRVPEQIFRYSQGMGAVFFIIWYLKFALNNSQYNLKKSLWPVTFFFNCHFLDLFALSFIDDTFFTLFLFCFERMHCIAGSRLILSVLFGRYIWRSELPKLGLRSDFFFCNLIIV